MDLTGATLDTLGRALRDGALHPSALVDAHIRRIRQVDPALNAIAVERFGAARRDAERAGDELAAGDDRGPLHGIPCTVKEFLAVQGLPHTGGVYARRHVLAERDATITARLREAGAIVLGTTNAPEGGLWHETHNRVYGRTANPHDLYRSSGGSSGGEGAVVAAGGSVFGIGSDVGGSIRLPAAFCGVYGHKPTHTMVPNTGHFPPAPPRPFMTCGPLGRSPDDLLAVLRVLAGPDPLDPLSRAWSLGDPADVAAPSLRVFVAAHNGQASVRPEVSRAVHDAGARLADAGARVQPLDLPELRQAFQIWAVLMGDLGVRYDQLLTDGGRVRLARELSRWARGRSVHTGSVLAMVGLQRLLDRLPSAVDRMQGLADALAERLEHTLGDDGVLLHPAFSRIAPRHRTIGLGNPFDVGLTAVFNIVGVPITVAPVATHRGLPIGVQLIGAAGRDHVTLAAAKVLSRDQPPFAPTLPRRGPPARLLPRAR